MAGGHLDRGLFLPTGVEVLDGNLVVADAWNHRVLVYDGLPTESFVEPAHLIGQDRGAALPNRGGEPALNTLYWPFGFALVAGVFWITDTGNRRVLGWRGGIPLDDRPADILLGQSDADARADNGGELGGATFRWPHMITGDDRSLYVVDAGDHRVLGFTPIPGLAVADSGNNRVVFWEVD